MERFPYLYGVYSTILVARRLGPFDCFCLEWLETRLFDLLLSANLNTVLFDFDVDGFVVHFE